MIYYRSDVVKLIAVDRKMGEVTVEALGTGKVRCVPIFSLRCTGGDGELRRAIRAVEDAQARCEITQRGI